MPLKREEDTLLRKILPPAMAAIALTAGVAHAQPKTVTLWHPFTLETDMIYGGIKKFNASQDQYRVEARVVPGPQIATELVRAVASGEVPDLATIDSPVVTSFSAQGALEDVTDRVKNSKQINAKVYFKGPWNSVTWKGKVYGVPRDANTIALYYNADMFRKAGLDPDKPPRTWKELMADAKKLTDPARHVYGFAFCATANEEGPFQWLPFLYQNGGSIDKLDQPEAAEALQFWVDFVKKGYASRDVINERQYEVTNTFMAGNSAMALGGPWELPRMSQKTKFDWRVAVLPVKADKNIHASSLGGYDFVIPKGAKDVDGAFKFIEFMSQASILNNGWKTGRIAPRSDIVIKNPEWPKAYAVFRKQLETARARGPHPEWPTISRAIQIAMQQALTGQEPAGKALKEAAAKIEPILAKTPLGGE